MIKEEFKIIKNSKGHSYKVSNKGYVMRFESFVTLNGKTYPLKPKRLKPCDNGNGYKYIQIGKGYENRYYVHRLVAKLFLTNNYNLKEVNHIDGNKANNSIENLEWVTSSDNKIHAINMGLMKSGGDHPYAITVKDGEGNIFSTIKEAAKYHKIHYGTLKDALRKNSCYKGIEKVEAATTK